MKDIAFLLVCSLIIYVFAKIILKEPLLPWKEKNRQKQQESLPKQTKKKWRKNKNTDPDILDDDDEAVPFEELFPNIKSIENHMIRHHDDTFTMIAEVDPVNYFLLDQIEQEQIDTIFETWLAQINYPVRIYLQNRFIDLTDAIEEIRKSMEKEEDLPPMAYEYGQKVIEELYKWQNSKPRFETKRFLIFDMKVDRKDIKASDKEELEEKIIEKAFNELYRRLLTAKQQLRKAEIQVNLLTTEGIGEVLYYTFNRRKAVKNRFKDVAEQEQLSLYVTADQSVEHIANVKGEIERVQKEKERKNASKK